MKLCLFCEHCCWDAPYAYSTLTEGGGDLGCKKGHGLYWHESDELDDLRKSVRQAETCPDYKQVVM